MGPVTTLHIGACDNLAQWGLRQPCTVGPVQTEGEEWGVPRLSIVTFFKLFTKDAHVGGVKYEGFLPKLKSSLSRCFRHAGGVWEQLANRVIYNGWREGTALHVAYY